MRDQLHLLRNEPWDVLIILDACRADVFRELCVPDAEVVHSPARRTDHWLKSGVGRLFRQRRPVYFAANPVCTREMWDWKEIERVDVWERWWARHGGMDLPYVHPLVVNGIVAAWADLGRLEGRAVVVHQLAPHSPYIGEPSYELTWLRRGIGGCEMTAELSTVSLWPNSVDIDWPRLRAAYRGNVRIAWEAARMLADRLTRDGRRVVITADHGDLLGEPAHGVEGGPPAFGHQSTYTNELLQEVPWLPWMVHTDEQTTKQKLEALGYR